MSFIQRNEVIQTLSADAPDEALAESVRLGRAERRFQNAEAHLRQGRTQLRRVQVVAVMDEEAMRPLSCDHFPELLERPVRGGMGGDVEVIDSAPAYFHDHEDVEDPKARRHGDEEIAGEKGLRMIANKGRPTLRREARSGPGSSGK